MVASSSDAGYRCVMTAAPPGDPIGLHTLMWRGGVGLLTIFAVVALVGWLAREPVTAVSTWFVANWGLAGVFVAVLAIDTVPLTHEPVLLVGISGGLGFGPVWASAAAGSVAAGVVGWVCGRVLGRMGWLSRLFERYRITEVLQRYGGYAVAVAALTPIPYAVTTWAAGAAHVPLLHVFLGSLVRILKVWIYLSLIVLGWSASG